MPPSVYLIVSFATDHPTAGNCLQNAHERVPYPEQFIELEPLEAAAADKMIRSVCHQNSRTLTAPQRNHILQAYANIGNMN